jgi:uncharacterized membrane protein YoaK (UPF0700 family)
MSRLKRALQYLGAIIVFIVGYGIVNSISHVIITMKNSDLHWLLTAYVVPYFVAIMAGFIGVVGALAIVERLFPHTPKRPVVWVFFGLMMAIWLTVILGLVLGIEPDLGTTAMAVQAVAAVVTAFKLTKSDRFESTE